MKKITLVFSLLVFSFSLSNAQDFLGKLWGMTPNGGTNGGGVIFNFDTAGSVYTIANNFPAIDGTSPQFGHFIQATDGNFYGLTSSGGTNGGGTIVVWNKTTNTESVIYSFGVASNDGIYPYGSLIQATDGNFYGMTYQGGTANYGTIFEWNTTTKIETVLYSFAGGTDGAYPQGSLLQAIDGNFYGMTYAGGGTNGYGVIFEWSFKTGTPAAESVLYTFGTNTNDGQNPYGSLIQATDGNFYGLTYTGGTVGDGAIIEWNTTTPAESIPYSFGSIPNDGNYPFGDLLQAADGNFYGTTQQGGTKSAGTIFEWSFNSMTPAESVLYNFTGGSDGGIPEGNLIQAIDGNLYGLVSSGGSSYGAIFEWNTTTPAESVLYSFGGGTADGGQPYGSLIQGLDGNFYGMTSIGGIQSNNGTIFEYNTSSPAESVLHFFGATTAGNTPYGTLIQASNGNFYGLTSSGGINNEGTMFKLTAAGSMTVMYNFAGNPTDGNNPKGSLVQAKDGNFYGVTTQGGRYNHGLIFEYDTTAQMYDTLMSFDKVNGSSSDGSLVVGTNGNLYGLTQLGGAHKNGVIFEWNTTTKNLDTLYSFKTGTDGSRPTGSLIQAKDGNFYGLTRSGGANGDGAIFEWDTTTKTEKVLYSFGGTPADGQSPQGSLIQATDGNFYGMTYSDGTTGMGTIFEWNTHTLTESVLYQFLGSATDGSNPSGSLIQGSDGFLYGMSGTGGNGYGTAFQFRINGVSIGALAFTSTNGASPIYNNLLEAMSDANIDSVQNCGGVKLTAQFRGAQRPFKVKWSTGDSTISITAPIAGTYSYTVTDARGITLKDSIVTTYYATPLAVNISGGGAICTGISSPLTASANGTPTYTYSWNNNSTYDTVMVHNAVTPGTGIVTTLAGSYNSSGSADGTGTNAEFQYPSGVVSDGAGNLYVTDGINNVIRKVVTATGAVTTLTGSVFNYPAGLVYDGAGNLYVCDYGNSEIDKVVIATGAVTVIAGNTTLGAADGTGTAASFNNPQAIAYDGTGNLYVTDLGNNEIRKIAISSGAVTTFAGSTKQGSADGIGNAAQFYSPSGIAYDAAGYLYITDGSNNTIRKINISTAAVTTIAGTAGATGPVDGIGLTARFNYPAGLVYDGSGDLYIADEFNYEIRKLNTKTDAVTTLAGSFNQGSGDGQGAAAGFASPVGLTLDAKGVLYVTDQSNYEVRKIVIPNTYAVTVTDGNGCIGSAVTIATLVPAATVGITIKNSNGGGVVCAGTYDTLVANATGTGSPLNYSWSNGATTDSLVVTASNTYSVTMLDQAGCTVATSNTITMNTTPTLTVTGNTSVCTGLTDAITANASGNGTLLYNWSTNGTQDTIIPTPSVTNVAMVSTLAGSTAGFVNAYGTAAELNVPYGVASDEAGNIYVTDYDNHQIREINLATGAVTTLAGSTNSGLADGIGAAASFDLPYGIVYDGKGNLYVSDAGNDNIRKIVIANASVTTIAGTGLYGSVNGIGRAASFSNPCGLALDGSGNLYVADNGNYEVRQIDLTTGAVTTLAGSTTRGNTNGIGAIASFNSPRDIAYDGAGNLYVTDDKNEEIRKIVISSATVSTFAGKGTAGLVNGPGASASFDLPRGIVYDGKGNLYIGDEADKVVRQIVIATDIVSTLAGSGLSGSTNGTATSARFRNPIGVTVDGAGNVYVADAPSNMIRKITLPNTYSVIVTDANGCKNVAGLGPVAVDSLPTVSVSGNKVGGNTVCAGLIDTLMANANVDGPFTYSWSTTGTHDSARVTAAGTYTVTVTNANLCVSTATVNVTVNSLPTVNISGNTSVTLGAPDTLKATGTSTSYVWTTGSTADTTIVTPLSPTTYTVTGTDANGCVNTATFTVSVNTTGITNVASSSVNSLYPNPTISSVNLTFTVPGGDEAATVSVMDALGKEVMTENTTIGNGRVLTLNVSMLAQGMYYIKVATNSGTHVERFVKSK